MNELIRYFESLESRLAAQEERIATLEAKVEELQNRPEPEPKVVEKIVEKVVEVEKPVEVIKEVIVEKPVPVVQETPQVPEIPETPETPEIPESPEPEPVVDPEPQPEPEPVKAPEPELFEEPAAPKAVLYGKPVDDIRQAISLGDRFLYQRELFGQNAELMQRTLTDLNALRSFDEAISYIMTHFHWDSESSTYQQFLVTLHRRFG